MKTCWMKLPSFAEVAHRLRERFDGASKVIARNDGKSFMTEGLSIKPPTKQDLVYTDESPDFCKPNPKTGSLGENTKCKAEIPQLWLINAKTLLTFAIPGVQNRECNITSSGEDGCDILCCTNGYQRSVTFVKSNCKCRFIWCCDVVCQTCTERRDIYTCLWRRFAVAGFVWVLCGVVVVWWSGFFFKKEKIYSSLNSILWGFEP